MVEAAARSLDSPSGAIGMCDYNLPLDELSPHDQEFLSGRNVCCGDDCQCADGSSPVACFADPCSVTPACAEAATCIANYCGGCNAEFYDELGNAVCQTADACQTDSDCPADEWCRQADPNVSEGSECVPFVSAGQSCNGFTPAWLYEQCGPGLLCDTPDFVADANAICRTGCASDDDCAPEQYCASDGACDADGGCELSLLPRASRVPRRTRFPSSCAL
jgi:hypothetical protein